MMIWGRLIGIILGYKLLGPLGAIIGFFIGNWFDQGLRLHLHHIPRSRSTAVQEAFFKATFLIMGHLAKVDGRVNEKEIAAARNVMARLQLTEELKQEAIQLFTKGKDANFELQQVLSEFVKVCKPYRDLLRFFIELQLEIALADGELNEAERHMLLLICERLHFSPKEFEQLWARQWASQAFHQWFSSQFDPNAHTYQYRYRGGQHRSHGGSSGGARNSTTSLQDAYGVLGVSPSASQAEIKKAYRRLMNQHHPDKLAARGFSEGMVNLAKEKTQQIRAAYDLIREARGFAK